MLFGSEEMKDLLIRSTTDPTVYDQAMEELYNSIIHYCKGKLKTGFEPNEIRPGSKPLTGHNLSDADVDDVIGKVMLAVKTSLDGFILNAKNGVYAHEAQRQSWLRTILYRQLARFYEEEKIARLNGLSLEAYYEAYGHDLVGSTDDFLGKECNIKEVVELACMASPMPEKVMAFLYNTVIFREFFGKTLNGPAKVTSNYMNNKRLYTLKEKLKEAIYVLYEVALTSKETLPLEVTLGKAEPTDKGMEKCSIDSKTVSDWSNRVKTYVFKHIYQM